MICERGNEKLEKTGSARLTFVRTFCLCLPIVFVFFLLVFAGFDYAAGCANPGKDGVGTPSGVVNTYYPATASVSAGVVSNWKIIMKGTMNGTGGNFTLNYQSIVK